MSKEKIGNLIDTVIVVLMVILMFGIPLFFTSYARSVFEVGKLLILRLFLLLVTAIWITKVIVLTRYESQTRDKKSYFKLLGLQWQKCYIEWPLYIWLMVNLLATIFSKNIYISIIGAYDRWEGIVTVINYILLLIIFTKLVKSLKALYLVIWAIITPTAISSIYGVYQRFGYDFMHWSVDPTKRVFACINNPVHYCAYVAMVVPLCVGWILYIAKRGKSTLFTKGLKAFIFVSAILIFYTQELSYSRAAWLGSVGAMTVFYLFASNAFNIKGYKELIIDFVATMMCLACIYLTFIFRLYQVKVVAFPCFFLIFLYVVYSYYIYRNEKDKFYLRLVIIALFAIIQHVSIVWKMRFLYIALIFIFTKLLKKTIEDTKIRKWLIAFLIMFGVVIAFEPFIHQVRIKFITDKTTSAKVLKTLESKVESYKVVALETAGHGGRASMWKTSWVWFKDYPLLGTGLDTVKYMYPTYRREDYGILEGGHNLTPDRVHNEYLNTLITTGILGFLARYLLLMGVMTLVVLWGLLKYMDNPLFYIMLASFCGSLVYLGQVFFNFGVVATLALYYILFGLAVCIAHQKENWDMELNEERYGPRVGHYVFYAVTAGIALIIAIYLESEYFDYWFSFAILGYFAISVILAYQHGFFTSTKDENDKKYKKIKEGDKFSFEDLSWGQTLILSFVWMITLFLVIPHAWSWAWQPWFAEWNYREGYEYFSGKQLQYASESLEKACKYAPWETHYRVYLGNIYENLGNAQTNSISKLSFYRKSEKEYQKIVDLDPINPWYLNRLSMVKVLISQVVGEKERKELKLSAEKLVEAAAKADRNNPIFQLNLAVFKHRNGKLDEALLSYKRTVAIDNRITDAYFNMANIYKQQGKIDLAVKVYEDALKKQPALKNIHLELGKLYFQLNKKDKALEEFEKEVSFNVDNEEARKLLRSLGRLKD